MANSFKITTFCRVMPSTSPPTLYNCRYYLLGIQHTPNNSSHVHLRPKKSSSTSSHKPMYRKISLCTCWWRNSNGDRWWWTLQFSAEVTGQTQYPKIDINTSFCYYITLEVAYILQLGRAYKVLHSQVLYQQEQQPKLILTQEEP